MIILSSKSKYAIAALLEMALNTDNTPVQSIKLATKRNMPAKLLEQIMNDLKRGGILKSFRGAKGGYVLAKPKEKISILEVVEIIEGPIELNSHNSDCETLKDYWEEVQINIKKCFNISLNELIYRQEKLNKIEVYSI